MLTVSERNKLDRIWQDTGNTVREWISVTVKDADSGDERAEKAARRFLHLYATYLSGQRAFHYMTPEDEQLSM